MKHRNDAFGQMLLDQYLGKGSAQVIERDDGLISVADPADYFMSYSQWSEDIKTAIKSASGKVLDIGCGAGRHALYLQSQNQDVLGIDISPLAIEVCHRRGLIHRRLLSITKASTRLGLFDTILLLGNNFGLFANQKRAKWLLRRFYAMTPPDGVILFQSTDPYLTDDPIHTAYHENNRRRGRLSGQLRIRVRYREIKDPWFDYLLVSLREMEEILCDTGWRIDELFDEDPPQYVTKLIKEK